MHGEVATASHGPSSVVVHAPGMQPVLHWKKCKDLVQVSELAWEQKPATISVIGDGLRKGMHA